MCLTLTFHGADASERALAQELRGIGVGVQEVPEWKQQALGKAPTFGIRDIRSIKEQRESLPIYKLRDQLVQAVHDNQVGAGGRYRAAG
jgi:ATP-dependent RNA helicase DHX8/PRP22